MEITWRLDGPVRTSAFVPQRIRRGRIILVLALMFALSACEQRSGNSTSFEVVAGGSNGVSGVYVLDRARGTLRFCSTIEPPHFYTNEQMDCLANGKPGSGGKSSKACGTVDTKSVECGSPLNLHLGT